MVYAYLRFSTNKQDESRQIYDLQEYAESRGLTIDVVEKDEGVSGGVSYRDRNLYRIIKKMKAGDILLVAEISRLGRAMADISKLLSEELKPRKVRLIVIKSGIDVDCANLKATDEFIFSALSFAAQIEKELIQQRTQSAMDVRKKAIEEDGGFITKGGRYCTHFGRKKGADLTPATRASAAAAEAKANEWRNESPLFLWVAVQLEKRRPRKEIIAEAQELYERNPEKWCTRRGKPLTQPLLSLYAKHVGLPKM